MKFILFFKVKDINLGTEKFKKLGEFTEFMKKDGKATSKALSPSYLYADGTGGFQLIEANSEDEIAALAFYYGISGEFTYKPIIETKTGLELLDQIGKFDK